MSNSDFLQLISAAVVISAVVYGVIQGVHYLISHRHKKRDEYLKSFDTVVAQLSSDNKTAQLAAAILLRRYFGSKENRKYADLHAETINVISALLRTLPTGVFQKTVGDGLAYAVDLSCADLQKTNMQDIYLGRKDIPIRMAKTDLFMADLSYALVENIDGPGAIFYHSILFNTQIKNSDFSGANFGGADLSNARFKNVLLKGADFSGAINVPEEISAVLIDGVCTAEERITTSSKKKGKSIFFSMPGCLSKYDEILTKDYKEILEEKGYDVIYYQKDDYPQYGQFNRIRQSILDASAMVAFGLKQVNIKDGVYHPDTTQEMNLKNKWLPTPWNELEVGMGLMNNLPILLVKDPAIDSGIFDDKLSECFVSTIPSDYDSRRLEANKAFIRWLDRI
jgi:uncharacterized protein YjbI with pentapeptide repeats